VALIFLYKCCKFGEKICNNSRDIEFFLGDHYFLACPVDISVQSIIRKISTVYFKNALLQAWKMTVKRCMCM